jgi:hypothetical protein
MAPRKQNESLVMSLVESRDLTQEKLLHQILKAKKERNGSD